mmetsp:Transcript_26997/g.68044  ORF Transcript_26997/g.68044 Transcript_26997/m.68044 type:complete len:293 (-) Transcript_26997:3094-3972(-)
MLLIEHLCLRSLAAFISHLALMTSALRLFFLEAPLFCLLVFALNTHILSAAASLGKRNLVTRMLRFPVVPPMQLQLLQVLMPGFRSLLPAMLFHKFGLLAPARNLFFFPPMLLCKLGLLQFTLHLSLFFAPTLFNKLGMLVLSLCLHLTVQPRMLGLIALQLCLFFFLSVMAFGMLGISVLCHAARRGNINLPASTLSIILLLAVLLKLFGLAPSVLYLQLCCPIMLLKVLIRFGLALCLRLFVPDLLLGLFNFAAVTACIAFLLLIVILGVLMHASEDLFLGFLFKILCLR